jgi:hypothetical protein
MARDLATITTRREEARQRFGDLLERATADL